MTPISIRDLAGRVNGTLVTREFESEPGETQYHKVSGFALDNRQVQPGDLFIAIKGENVDGHDFAAKAIAAGAVATLAEREVPGPHIRVQNVVEALARLGLYFRAQFSGPVLGITGSAGKTTTKEFAVAALSPLGPVLKAEGNRNTEFTSPLLWTELTPEHKAVVVEMGMRGFGQIAHLAKISMPTIGLITNVGWSHAELVGSREGIAQAKGELLQALPNGAPVVLWQEDDFLSTLKALAKGPVFTFGWGESATCRITDYRAKSWWSCEVVGTLDQNVILSELASRPTPGPQNPAISNALPTGVSALRQWRAELPAVGRHIALNAAAAILAAVLAGVPLDRAASALKDAKLPPMRMEVRSINGATVVLDTYNAAPNSVLPALEALAEIPTTGRRMVVLGEMRELGSESEKGHRLVGTAAARLRLDHILLYGATANWMREAALEGGMREDQVGIAQSLDEITDFLEALHPTDTVLIKGSRSLELERALEPLEEV